MNNTRGFEDKRGNGCLSVVVALVLTVAFLIISYHVNLNA